MNSSNQDPYIILGLLSGTTEKQIKKAYRRLAMKFHPDKNQDDPDAKKYIGTDEIWDGLTKLKAHIGTGKI